MPKLFVVPTPIGNLDDITLRALRVLSQAAFVLAEDTRTTSVLLKHHGLSVPLSPFHLHNEHRATPRLVMQIGAADSVALVSDAGTPGISDPGFLLVRACLEAGIEVECLPGATAFVPALVQSGFPTERFTFEGFLPVKKGRHTRIAAIAAEPRTTVLYESPHRIVRLLSELAEALPAGRLVSVSRELTKIHAETRTGSAGELLAHFQSAEPRGEFVVVIGPTPRPTAATDVGDDGED